MAPSDRGSRAWKHSRWPRQSVKHSSDACTSNVFHLGGQCHKAWVRADPPQKGCPVATVAINNSINAAQLAARILATSDMHTDIRKRLKQHLADQTSSVLEDSLGMERLGFEAFCSQG